MKHVVCFSGGHSSALVAIEVVRRYGPDGVVLLNHDINPRVEDADIKRFKGEVAAYLGLPITYANYRDPEADQFDIAVKHSAFKAAAHTSVICTSRLKTEPFERWLKQNAPQAETTIYYGFDANEPQRIQRRATILASQGYRSEYPLAHWPRSIQSTKDIGIEPPLTYGQFKHANCVGCLKAGAQHWYVVFCTRPDIWAKAKTTEEIIGHSIMKAQTLEEIEDKFRRMKCAGIAPTEHIAPQTFWANVRKVLGSIEAMDSDAKPCECVF